MYNHVFTLALTLHFDPCHLTLALVFVQARQLSRAEPPTLTASAAYVTGTRTRHEAAAETEGSIHEPPA